MSGSDLREQFLRFFETRDHRRVASSSLVPGDDATLLFTNAGMNQFKEVFLGHEVREYQRAATAQKCLRVSGKHNDLEQVGRTARHHTFFEMLGNFSFGDYFKEEAIRLAWDFLVAECGLEAGRLWFTVYNGEGGFPPDDEAYEMWSRLPVPRQRILRLGEKDNFWRMGETGPCGPCTEIHVDQGEGIGCGRAACDPACDCDRFLEVWNLVFMQYEQRADGTVRPLPAPCVDTGMGLERLAAVVQGVRSNYETDLFAPLLRAVGETAGRPYGAAPDSDISLRVIADHLRAVTFLVADGVTPSNAERGYVLRRILRRAATHAWLLGQHPPFLHRFIRVVVDQMRWAYPDLAAREDYISQVCRQEEEGFRATLERGMEPLRQVLDRARAENREEIPGEWVFPLYDSMGMPLDQIVAAAQQAGRRVSLEGFEREMERQRERARAAARDGEDALAREGYRDLAAAGRTHFLGYETLSVEGARVVALMTHGQPRQTAGGAEAPVEVVLDRTPFYAESGGQIGDVGSIESSGGKARVQETFSPVPGVTVHRGTMVSGDLQVGDTVVARVDPAVRPHTMRNHTATHLLHAALQRVLGPHARQAGSYVGPDRLRFDFNHFQPMTVEEIAAVEDLVNGVILEDHPVSATEMGQQEALASGAVAFFGEKYGDRVRVVDVPGFSRELCGGTHCDRTGKIGAFRIVAERGISAGVRRVEALTGMGVLQRLRDTESLLGRLESVLSARGDDLPAAADRALRKERELEREVERLRLKLASGGGEAVDDIRQVDGIKVLARRVEDLDRTGMRNLADTLRERIRPGVVVLGAVSSGKAALLVAVTDDIRERLDARRVIRELAPMVGGGGGGNSSLAEAGGKEVDRLPAALEASHAVVRRLLGEGR